MEDLKVFKYIRNDYECSLKVNTKSFWKRIHDTDNWFGILEIKYKNESIFQELTNINFTEQYLGYFQWLCDELIKSYEKKLNFNVCCSCDHITETRKIACWYGGKIEKLNVCKDCLDDYCKANKIIKKCDVCGRQLELDDYHFYFEGEKRWFCVNGCGGISEEDVDE